ncbi:MAG: ATP-dependent DNA helicase [Desulfobulbaceae bacterium]|nr:ATP-dependent DNA helicase [Desulfobulbaceae bacterium]
MPPSLDDIFADDGLLARRLSHYEQRPGQRQMAEAALTAFQRQPTEGEENILVVEAETGIGKTMAYCLPAILADKKVVISTATINLQDQIIGKDIPLLEQVLEQQIKAICLKGRQNYLCLYRWFQYASLAAKGDKDVERIGLWLQKTEFADRAELGWLADHSPLWLKISAQANQCLGNDCPEAADCFLQRARRAAAQAKIVVVNHHLFFSDLALRRDGHAEVIPRYQCVVFDEAHHIEAVAGAYFGYAFSQYQLLDLLADMMRQAKTDAKPAQTATIAALIASLEKRGDRFFSFFPPERGRYPLDPFLAKLPNKSNFNEAADELALGLKDAADDLATMEPDEIWNLFAKRCQDLEERLALILDDQAPRDANYVYWYERRERTISLAATPILMAEQLRRNLYEKAEAVLMTSATLSAGGDFTFIKSRLGLPETAVFARFASPFDYKNRSLLYVPGQGFPEPTSPSFTTAVGKECLELLRFSKGRALVLFTSIKSMDQVATTLRGALTYPILVQGEASRRQLLATFKKDAQSVLLAVASFWEGVDVPGDALRLVVIDKLPFEVPTDPVLQARVAQINQDGGNAFFSLQIPKAILSLRQGVGRLMRQSSDWGVMAVLDPRLFSKGYGRHFRASLPSATVVRDLPPVKKFFEKYQVDD